MKQQYQVPVIHSEHFTYTQLKNLTWPQPEVIREDSNITSTSSLVLRQVVIASPKPMPCWASAATVPLETRVLPVPWRFPQF